MKTLLLISLISMPLFAANKPAAKAVLESKSKSMAHGVVKFYKSHGKLIAKVTIENATPGMHGFHIHEKGDCSAADASSAGAHYNPGKSHHGGLDTAERHAGDLGNIEVLANGTGLTSIEINATEKEVIGKSLVLHAGVDDMKSDPAGNSGARIACGVITK